MNEERERFLRAGAKETFSGLWDHVAKTGIGSNNCVRAKFLTRRSDKRTRGSSGGNLPGGKCLFVVMPTAYLRLKVMLELLSS